MPGNDLVARVDQDRIGEPKAADRGDDLVDLALGMGPRVARVWDQRVRGLVGDGSGRSEAIGGSILIA